MSTFTQTLHHIVFSTKNRTRCLKKPNRPHLYKYIWGILKHKNCHLYRIGGVEDHLYLLTDLHPTIALSDLIKDIKIASSKFISEEKLFPRFYAWQEGYGAFTCSVRQKVPLIEYVKNQEEHHRKVSFTDELVSLLNENGVAFDERYLL